MAWRRTATSRPVPTASNSYGTFYSRALTDPLIGWIFVDVAKLDLEAHVPKVTSFWETILLGAGTYGGGAFAPHVAIHQRSGGLREAHFQRWLVLWRGGGRRVVRGAARGVGEGARRAGRASLPRRTRGAAGAGRRWLPRRAHPVDHTARAALAAHAYMGTVLSHASERVHEDTSPCAAGRYRAPHERRIRGGRRTDAGRQVRADTLSHIRTDDLLGQTMVAACERAGSQLDRSRTSAPAASTSPTRAWATSRAGPRWRPASRIRSRP